MAAPKFGYPALALLDWLCEAGMDRRLFTSGDAFSSRGLYLFEASAPDDTGKQRLTRVWPVSGRIEDNPEAQALIERLGGRDSIDYHALYQAKFLKGFHSLGHSSFDQKKGKKEFEQFVSRFDANRFHYSDSVVIVTPAGFEFWKEKGRKLAAEARARRDEERRQISRRILIGQTVSVRPRLSKDLARRIPASIHFPLPGRQIVVPYALATVTRQTATRLYIRDVRQLPAVGEGGFRHRLIGGSFPHQYVDPSAVLVDGCTEELAERLHAIAREFQDDVDAIGERIVMEMLPGLIDLNSRILQKDAERADSVSDALKEAGHKVRAPGDPPDNPDDEPSPRGP
jgi:hypothetical protein